MTQSDSLAAASPGTLDRLRLRVYFDLELAPESPRGYEVDLQ